MLRLSWFICKTIYFEYFWQISKVFNFLKGKFYAVFRMVGIKRTTSLCISWFWVYIHPGFTSIFLNHNVKQWKVVLINFHWNCITGWNELKISSYEVVVVVVVAFVCTQKSFTVIKKLFPVFHKFMFCFYIKPNYRFLGIIVKVYLNVSNRRSSVCSVKNSTHCCSLNL